MISIARFTFSITTAFVTLYGGAREKIEIERGEGGKEGWRRERMSELSE
jgi:hypothetical protein